MSSTFRRLGESELLPRYIFAESLYARRRVLEVGAVASTLGQSARFLSTRGARIVVAADADLAAVADAQSRLAGPNLRFRATVFDDFEGGSFDLVIVADLASYVRAPTLLAELARLVAKNGYLMGGLRNPAGLALSTVWEADETEAPPTYGMLLDSLTSHFNSIEVATQSPVLGYQLAFERGEGLQVDGSLAGHAEAAYYVVLAGQEPVRNFDPTWVQLPPEPLAFTGGKLEDASARARDWRERSERLKEALTRRQSDVTARELELGETKEQLEATKEAVARLGAQLETLRDRPAELQEREELAARLRRIEGELQVTRERAADAEGRATASKRELEAFQRAQKDAVVGALAMHEQVRLERARREEVGTQLEDARGRLAHAYEDLRASQDAASTTGIEMERQRSQAERLRESLSAAEADAAAARQREVSLADARTEALKAIEHLERSLAEARQQLSFATEERTAKELERQSFSRAAEVERSRTALLEGELQRAEVTVNELAAEQARRAEELSALDTELQSARASHARTLRDIETLSASERTWRELAQQYEQRLADTTANVQQLSDQLAQLEALRDGETARMRRLELDLTTAVTGERNLREQAQALAHDLQARIKELSDDREALIEERDDVRGALGDLQKARRVDLEALEEARQVVPAQAARISGLEAELHGATQARTALAATSADLERGLRALLDQRSASLEEERVLRGELERQLRASATRVGELDGELALRAAQLENTRKDLADLLDQAARLTGEGQTLRAELVRQHADAVSARTAWDDERKALLEKQQAAELEWSNQVRDLDVQVAAATERAQQQEVRGAGLASQLSELEASSKAEHARLRGEADDVAARLGEARTLAQDATERITTLREQLGAARDEITATAQALAQTTARLDEVTRERDAHAQRAEALDGQLATLTAQTQALTHQLQQREQVTQADQARIAALEASVQAASAELAQARSAATAELGAARSELEGVRAEDARRLQSLQAELDRAIAESTERAAASSRSSEELRGELEGLRVALQDAAAAKSVELEVRRGLEGEQTRLQTELTVATAARDEQRARVAQLERAVAEQTQTSEAATSAWAKEREALVDAGKRELEATTQAAARSLDVRHAEAEQRLQALREEHQRGLEVQASAYRASLEEHRADSERVAAAREAVQASQHAELKVRLGELERQRDDARGEVEQARALAQQHRQAQSAETELLKRQLEDLALQLDRTKSEARGHQSGKMAFQAETERLREELGQLRASLAMAGGETKAMGEVRAKLEAELDRLRQDVPVLQTEVEQLRARVPLLDEEAARLRARVPELETSLEAERGRSTDAERARADAATRVTALEAEVEQLRTEGPGVRAALSNTQARLLDSQSASSELRERVGVLEEEVARHRAERPMLENELAELRLRAAQYEQQLLEAQRDLPESGAEVSELRQRLPELQAELELARVSAKNEVDAAATARRQAEELLLALRVKYGDLQSELTSATEQLDAARAARVQLSEITAENELLEVERTRLAEQVESWESQGVELATLRMRVVQLEQELAAGASARAELRDAEGRLASMEVEVARLKLENELLARDQRLPPAALVEERTHTGATSPSGVRKDSPSRPPVFSKSRPPPVQPAPVVVPPPSNLPTVVVDFELEIQETNNGDTEEIVLLDEEATDPGKDPKKK